VRTLNTDALNHCRCLVFEGRNLDERDHFCIGVFERNVNTHTHTHTCARGTHVDECICNSSSLNHSSEDTLEIWISISKTCKNFYQNRSPIVLCFTDMILVYNENVGNQNIMVRGLGAA
jgi:hypothetical protein